MRLPKAETARRRRIEITA
ncbi:MAG: hypothetical protein M3N17_05960 [Actinomycetota bacterium]|nr:hypothetical protein [Actinomycetota bacterium]